MFLHLLDKLKHTEKNMNSIIYQLHNRYIIYLITFACFLIAINILIIRYIKNEQAYKDQSNILTYHQIIETLVINNIKTFQKTDKV
jgi:hypothetical protein